MTGNRIEIKKKNPDQFEMYAYLSLVKLMFMLKLQLCFQGQFLCLTQTGLEVFFVCSMT